MPTLYSYKNHEPLISDNVFIAPGALIIGDVQIADECSIWYNAVIRGDVNHIHIGRATNIQDNSTLHASSRGKSPLSPSGIPTIIGSYVTVGHNCTLHACTIEDGCLIGMGAIVLDGATIGKGSIIGSGALVLTGTVIPPFSVAVGSPAKIIKTLDESTYQERINQAERYYTLACENMLNRPV